MDDPVWQDWSLQAFMDELCGGHWYINHETSTQDVIRQAERAYYTGGKYQVMHRHPHGDGCVLGCRAFGREGAVPRLREAT
jgi:hypothetical protein